MGISFDYLNIERTIEFKPVIRKLIRELISKEGKQLGEVSIIFTGNSTILEINRSFLNHHYFTDVITFRDNKKNRISGDIYISVEQVLANSGQYHTQFVDEITRVVIHGILHLIGYEDNNAVQKKVMKEKEDSYLCRFKNFDYVVGWNKDTT